MPRRTTYPLPSLSIAAPIAVPCVLTSAGERLGSNIRIAEKSVVTGSCTKASPAKTTNPIAVGDRVTVEVVGDATGVILDVCDRKNYLIRRSSNLSRQAHIVAANVDRAYLVVSLAFPDTKPGFVDRFLVSAEAYHIPVTILINKVDLYEEELAAMLTEFEAIYQAIGYETIRVSAHRGDNIAMVREQLSGKIAVFAGNSGVGKSSLINAIDPLLKLRTGEISEYHLKGTHTTTFYEMVELPNGGFIIDTPGLKSFGLIDDIGKDEISHFFPEIFRYSTGCKFNMCTHTDEPVCAVKKAVEEGLISPSRYNSYLSMFYDEDSKYR